MQVPCQFVLKKNFMKIEFENLIRRLSFLCHLADTKTAWINLCIYIVFIYIILWLLYYIYIYTYIYIYIYISLTFSFCRFLIMTSLKLIISSFISSVKFFIKFSTSSSLCFVISSNISKSLVSLFLKLRTYPDEKLFQ